ncbi:chaperone protein dnaJ 11, chloroplastic [Momordica charantia]|uniref:Chaperone protein dnaJ 11, chloroplastic n=1 Tax=Momordica charantia TaxID=3673 RepID=A0A6J1CDJ0_MOMCH|nr:chaperone protein dnaJ 11, chloroplastic [Momordica charantia]
MSASAKLFAPPLASGSRRSSASFYDILRVNHNASSVEIKTAYRSLAKIYHPDSSRKSDCDGSSFIEIHNAYETLSDPATRAHYDLALAALTRRSYLYSVGSRSRPRPPHRRWETDQCW